MNKSIIQFLSNVFPSFFAKKLYHHLLNPQVRAMKEKDREVLAKAEKEILTIHNNSIYLYTWGSTGDKILLVHGWEGNAGNYSYLIEQLLANQYMVYAFDAPGHGNSSGGANVMFEFINTVKTIITQLGIKKVISHSFGSVATTYSLAQLPDHKIDKYVLLTTPCTFRSYVSNISGRMGLSERAINLFLRKLEKEIGEKIDELDVSKYVQKMSVTKAIIIHDVMDKVIPISEAEEVAHNWKNAEIFKISNTGHFRILRTPDVANITIDFMNQ